jgi:5,6-dimethylbenzimidazole synthase
MAVHTLWLAARAEGIGVGWVSILDPGRIAAILQTPPGWAFIGYLCVGYSQEESETPALERDGWEKRGAPDETILYR